MLVWCDKGLHYKYKQCPPPYSHGWHCCCCCCYVRPAFATGVPTALRLMPGLLDVVKSAVAREASQLFDKLAFVAGKVRVILFGFSPHCVMQQDIALSYMQLE